MQHLYAQTEGTDWNELLPVPDRKPAIIPPPYTNRNLIQEGYTDLCLHPNLEKAVIERGLNRWGEKFKNAQSDGMWYFAKNKMKHFATWNRQWLKQYSYYATAADLKGIVDYTPRNAIWNGMTEADVFRKQSEKDAKMHKLMDAAKHYVPYWKILERLDDAEDAAAMNRLFPQEPTDDDIVEEMDYFGQNR